MKGATEHFDIFIKDTSVISRILAILINALDSGLFGDNTYMKHKNTSISIKTKV